MSKIIQRFRATLEAVGASLDTESSYALYAEAPLGYVWKSTGLSSYIIPYATNSQTWLVKAIRGELTGLNLGFRLASEDETADINHGHGRGGEGEDPSWVAPEGSPEEIAFKFIL